MKPRFAVLAVVLLGFVTLFTACQTKEVTSAKVYIQQDNWDKAIEQLEMAVEMYPADAEAHYLLGEGYSQKQDWAGMNEMFEKSLKIAPTWEQQIKSTRDKNWVNNFNSGVANLNKNEVETALYKFKTATLIDPTRADAFKTLAIAYTRVDSLDKAKSNFSKVLELEPDNKDAINGLASLHFQLKEYKEVIDIEEKALKLDPEDKDAIANMALAYDFLGEKEKAQETYEIALVKNPGDKDLLFNLARLHFLNDEYDKAISLFTQVIDANPDDYDANLSIGNAYLSMGDEYRKKLVDKENAGEEVTSEERAKLKGFYQEAIPYLEKAKEKCEGDPDTKCEPALYNNLGVAYVQIGDAEKGGDYFKKAEELQ